MLSSKTICLWLVFAFGMQGARAADSTLDKIWQVFAERQAAATTARVSWTAEYYYSGNKIAGLMKGLQKDKQVELQGSLESKSPPSPRKLVISGPRAIRFENVARSFAGSNSGTLVRSATAVNKNGLYQTLTEPSQGMDHYTGLIKNREAAPAWGQVHIKPLVWALRPLRPEAFGPDPKKWDLVDKPAMINGQECVVIRMMMRATIVEMFLDHARDYIPLRSTLTRTDKKNKPVVVRIDARYDRKQEPRWIPSGWTTTTWMFTGAVSQKSKNSEVEVELGIPISAEVFNIDYPPGAHVIDSRKEGKAKYVVVADKGEFVPHRQLKAQQTAASSGGYWLWYALAATGGGVIVLAIFLRKRGIA